MLSSSSFKRFICTFFEQLNSKALATRSNIVIKHLLNFFKNHAWGAAHTRVRLIHKSAHEIKCICMNTSPNVPESLKFLRFIGIGIFPNQIA